MKFIDIINSKDTINIGFMGGSITAVGMPEDPRYPKSFLNILRNQYPNKTFNEINIADGGTRSVLGLFKMSRDLLSKDPDIIFVEYSVNDSGGGDRYLKFFENITRTALKYKPSLPIVYLFAYTKSLCEGNSRETPAKIYQQHKEIADAYNIPCIYMGYDLKDKIEAEGGDALKFTSDTVHPNIRGIESYAESINNNIYNFDFAPVLAEKPVHGIDFNDPKMIICAEEPLQEGWAASKARTLWQSDLHYVYADEPGTTITFEFEGTVCAVYTRMEKDGGNMDIYIDGKYDRYFRFWDGASIYFDRNAIELIEDELPYGKHEVKLVIRPEREPDSEGHVARIAAFFAG